MFKNNFILHDNNSEEILTIEQLALRQLLKIQNGDEKIIRFPQVFGRLGKLFHLTKKESWQILNQLQKNGNIEIVVNSGIILKVIDWS